jgi:hypothetical protein
MSRAVLYPLVASIMLYAVWLACPAFHALAGTVPQLAPGYLALAVGWFAALFALIGLPSGNVEPPGTLTWLVNPLLLASWVLAWRRRGGAAVTLALLAFVVSLGFVFVRTIPVPDNGTYEHIVPGAGYVLWVLSTVCALWAARRIDRAEPTLLRTFKL